MAENYNLEFRKIKSLLFLYEVSEDGKYLRNVKSKKYIKIFFDTHHSQKGYYACFINLKGKVKKVIIHEVVAECWLGECPDGYQVEHIDRNSHNNHYTNLRYCTHSEQMKNKTLSEEMIERCKANCQNHNSEISIHVTLLKENEKLEFRSISEASRRLSIKFNTKYESIRYKLKKRRKNIYGYDAIYLNAET